MDATMNRMEENRAPFRALVRAETRTKSVVSEKMKFLNVPGHVPCLHPSDMVFGRSNQYAHWTTCGKCRARLTYQSKRMQAAAESVSSDGRAHSDGRGKLGRGDKFDNVTRDKCDVAGGGDEPQFEFTKPRMKWPSWLVTTAAATTCILSGAQCWPSSLEFLEKRGLREEVYIAYYDLEKFGGGHAISAHSVPGEAGMVHPLGAELQGLEVCPGDHKKEFFNPWSEECIEEGNSRPSWIPEFTQDSPFAGGLENAVGDNSGSLVGSCYGEPPCCRLRSLKLDFDAVGRERDSWRWFCGVFQRSWCPFLNWATRTTLWSLSQQMAMWTPQVLFGHSVPQPFQEEMLRTILGRLDSIKIKETLADVLEHWHGLREEQNVKRNRHL